MFFATTLLYPAVLLALCLGAGLLLERLGGWTLPLALMPIAGAALLIAVSQLSTYIYPLAPATPYLLCAAALGGALLARTRLAAMVALVRARAWLLLVPLLTYAIALAPVLADGRPSFSSYMALADSAVHMLGASYLVNHGQHYSGLNLRYSTGLYINDYYNSSYPSGADTLYGSSSLLLGLPLTWSFQPFNAFMLALASGPAWVIARRMGLAVGWAAPAALTAVLPALVYAYELFGSIKEITALGMILALGALVCLHRSWLLGRGPRAAIPFALIAAAGLSALGIAFGVWALVAVGALGVPLLAGLARRERPWRATAVLLACALVALLVAALPTWGDLSGSVSAAQGIAATSNPGNLVHPLRAIQVFGVWLGGSYKLLPSGADLSATHVLVAVSLLAALLGAVELYRRRSYALLAWFALMLLAWLIVARSVTTWGAAKTLMLTSPAVVLLAWAGVGALARLRPHALALIAPAVLAIVLAGGALASDAMQYHVSNLAPTARYEELASLDSRFAGQGPALFTDFDEYSMYELRRLDVAGPDFTYPPPAAAVAAGGHGKPVDLERLSPAVLSAYPLIITRRDPAQPRPPAAYRLAWQGRYYQVWRRERGAAVALSHVALAGSPARRCAQVARLARRAGRLGGGGRSSGGTVLSAALAPAIVRVALARAHHPRGWGHERRGLVMSTGGALTATVFLRHGGGWDVWLQGQFMPAVKLSVDGRAVETVSGELDGNSLVPNTVPPVALTLGAGVHHVSIARAAEDALAPGQGGAAVLDGILLTQVGKGQAGTKNAARGRAGARSEDLVSYPAADWRALCARRYQWVELLPGGVGSHT